MKLKSETIKIERGKHMVILGIIEYIICAIALVLCFIIPHEQNTTGWFTPQPISWLENVMGRVIILLFIFLMFGFLLNPITWNIIEDKSGNKEYNDIMHEKEKIEKRIKIEKEIEDAKKFIKENK